MDTVNSTKIDVSSVSEKKEEGLNAIYSSSFRTNFEHVRAGRQLIRYHFLSTDTKQCEARLP